MTTKKQLFYLVSVRDSLKYIMNQLGFKYNIKVSEIHKMANFLNFEIYTDCFNIEFYNYLHEHSDFMEVLITEEGAVFKVKFNLVL